MGFEITDHYVDAPLDQFVSVFQHLIGFSDAGGKPQIHLKPTALVGCWFHHKLSAFSFQLSAFSNQLKPGVKTFRCDQAPAES
jgi:hypothetical protein